MWTATGVWSNSPTYASSNQPLVNVDAGGNWSGWIYAKHNNGVAATGKVRAAKVGSTGTNLTGATLTFNILDMSTGGGWIFRSTSPAVNKGILAYSGAAVVGSYRTEDNGIVERYRYGAGGFKIAVPAGFVDSLVSINDDGSRDQAFPGPWYITAGQETDACTGSGVAGKGTASISPSLIGGGTAQSVLFTLRGEAPVLLTNAKIVFPPSWSWSHSTGDISVTGGGTPLTPVAGDAAILSALSLSGTDKCARAIHALAPPDSAVTFAFLTLAGTSPDSIFLISTQPSVFVYSLPRPISTVRQSDANCVPLANNTLVTVRGIITVANDGPSTAGSHSVTWNAAGLASGV